MYHGYTEPTEFEDACREAGVDSQVTAERIGVLRDQCECKPVGPVCWACQKRYALETELGINQEIPF